MNNTEMKQKTAVEFLQESLMVHFTFEHKMQFEGLFQQAKELERQQIVDAYKIANSDGYNEGQYEIKPDFKDGEQYYNNTYGE